MPSIFRSAYSQNWDQIPGNIDEIGGTFDLPLPPPSIFRTEETAAAPSIFRDSYSQNWDEIPGNWDEIQGTFDRPLPAPSIFHREP